MVIDFKKYDEISKIEEALEKLLKYINLEEYELSILNYENQILLILTIITILYKEYIENEYVLERIPEQETKLTYYNYVIEELLQLLDKCIQEKNIIKANKIINKYGNQLQQIIKRYYKRKNKNYIIERMSIELITNNNQVMDLIELNPFAINQCMNHIPLTQNEKIIYDIIEYYDNCKENFISIKKLLIKNYPKQKLEKAIIFIINNVYQELLEDKTENTVEIKCVVENQNIKNSDIIEQFIENDNFSSKYLEYFILYNLRIKEKRLEELKEKPSYQYVKKRNI